jgi:hypothetical protein
VFSLAIKHCEQNHSAYALRSCSAEWAINNRRSPVRLGHSPSATEAGSDFMPVSKLLQSPGSVAGNVASSA